MAKCDCSSVRAELTSLSQETEERVPRTINEQLEKLNRDTYNLPRACLKITNAMKKLLTRFDVSDKLEALPN